MEADGRLGVVNTAMFILAESVIRTGIHGRML